MSAFTSFMASPAPVRISRVIVGLVLLAAALGKIGDPAVFASQIQHYRMFPGPAVNLVAIVLPWIELVTGLALVLGIRARAGAWLGVAMVVVFTLAVGQAVARGLDIECGCFGTADGGRVGAVKLLENLALLAGALIASRRAP